MSCLYKKYALQISPWELEIINLYVGMMMGGKNGTHEITCN